MTNAKSERQKRAALEASERRTRALNSLAMCLSRSNVMRMHHNLFIQEIDARGGMDVVWASDAAKVRFTTYVAYWFAALAAVIERYQELTGKGTIESDSILDGMLTENNLSLVKPFRNAVAHCSDYADERILNLLASAETLPDWAETVAQQFRRYLLATGVVSGGTPASVSGAEPQQTSSPEDSHDMDDHELQTLLSAVETSVPGAHEIYRCHSLVGYRDRPEGGTEKFEVDILDAGPSRPHLRYSVRVRTENGGFASGNPAESVELAVALVHFENIDRNQAGAV